MAERLYRTTDGTIVPEGHADAAFLVVGASGVVSPEYADAVEAFQGRTKAKATPKVKAKRTAKPKG